MATKVAREQIFQKTHVKAHGFTSTWFYYFFNMDQSLATTRLVDNLSLFPMNVLRSIAFYLALDILVLVLIRYGALTYLHKNQKGPYRWFQHFSKKF